MAIENLYSPDYVTARERFRAAARHAGAALDSLTIAARGPGGEALTIDIARLGDKQSRRVLLHSSGLHGVEAFAGSAVQLAALQRRWTIPPRCALIFAHVLNPFGMAWLRRTNENNVDLNRNFLPADGPWRGAAALYAELDPLLNPRTPPGVDAFWARLALLAFRHGIQRPRQAIAEGQYEYPRGLFYGGSRLEEGPARYRDWIRQALRQCDYVLAVDVHTGIGPCGEETAIVSAGGGATPLGALSAALGRSLVDPAAATSVYRVRGGLGESLANQLPGVRVDFILQEIGTRPAGAVLHALREENRAHYYGGGHFPHEAKRRLRDAMSPPDPDWRRRAVEKGLSLIEAGAAWVAGLGE